MACNSDWIASKNMKNDLEKYVRQNIQKREILDCVKRDYRDYPWSMATLGRRLRYFDTKYIDYDTLINAYLLGARKQYVLWSRDGDISRGTAADHKIYCLPEGPVNKCFINISSVKVNDSIKKTKTVFIEQNDAK